MLNLLFAQATLTASIVAGGLNTLSSQDSYTLTPMAAIEVNSGLMDNEYTPELHVHALLAALPEEKLDLIDAVTFKSLEFETGIAQKLPSVYAKLYGGFGLATRLPGDKEPRINTAKYFTFGIRFATKNDQSYLYIGGGPDQRLDPRGYYAGNAHIEGQIKLAQYKDGKLFLKGNAILGGQSSLVRVGVVIGI